MRKFLFSATMLAGAVAAGTCLVSVPASAQLVSNQWYAGNFSATPSPVFAGGAGLNGPLAGGGFANSTNLPASTSNSWTINMPSAGGLTVTDIQTAGDQFKVFINGSSATPIQNTWLNPAGQSGTAGGDTSVPCPPGGAFCDSSAGNNIAAGLADANYSSGTFALPQGNDTISLEFLAL